MSGTDVKNGIGWTGGPIVVGGATAGEFSALVDRIAAEEGARKGQNALQPVPMTVSSQSGNDHVLTQDAAFADVTLGGSAVMLITPTVTNPALDPTYTVRGVTRILRGGNNEVLQAGAVVAGVPFFARMYSSTTMRLVGPLDRQAQVAKLPMPLEVSGGTANAVQLRLPADFQHLLSQISTTSLFWYTPTMTNTAVGPKCTFGSVERTFRGPNFEDVQIGQIEVGVPILVQPYSTSTMRILSGKVAADLKADKTELAATRVEMRNGRVHTVFGYQTPSGAPVPADYSAETLNCVYDNVTSFWRRDTAPVGNAETVDWKVDASNNWWRRLIIGNPDGRVLTVIADTPSGVVVPSGTDRIDCLGTTSESKWRLSTNQTSPVAEGRVQVGGGAYWIRVSSTSTKAATDAVAAQVGYAMGAVVQRGSAVPARPANLAVCMFVTYDDPSDLMIPGIDRWTKVDPAPLKVFQDDFNRANGYLDDDSDDWLQVAGSGGGSTSRATIMDQTLRVGSANIEIVTQTLRLLTPDHFVEAAIMSAQPTDAANYGVYLYARMLPAKNSGYRLILRNTVWVLQYVKDGTGTNLAAGTFAASNYPFTARLEAKGSALKAIIGGATVATVTDSRYMAGHVGIGLRVPAVEHLPKYQIDTFRAGVLD